MQAKDIPTADNPAAGQLSRDEYYDPTPPTLMQVMDNIYDAEDARARAEMIEDEHVPYWLDAYKEGDVD